MGMFDFTPGEPTWEAVERRRRLAEALQANIGTPTTFGQGLSALGAALGGVVADRRADRMDADRAKLGDDAFEAALNGMPQDNSALAAALAPAGASFASSPGAASFAPSASQPHSFGADGSIIRQGLVDRGLPEHVADAFVLNFKDESGLNPGINEQNPIVPGSRGGFGLAQWTGSRRRALEAFAAQRAAPVSDPNVQMDFLMTELQGPERRAAQSILSAPDTGRAAAAVVNDFLRPAEEHRARREANYLSGAGGASAAPSTPGMAPVSMPAPPPVNVALIRAMNNPYMTPEQKQILGGIYQQQLAMQITPYQQAQLQMAQQEHALRMQQATAPEPVRGSVIGQRLVNPQTGEVMADFTAETQAGFRQAAPEEAAAYGAAGGQFGPDGRFYPINPPSGFAVETGPDGQVRVVQGSGASGAAGKPFTEGQSKDVVFATRANGALEAFEPYAEALTSRGDRAAEAVPMGLARGMQSPEFQMAKNAGDEFLQAILRKDTGAAITADEQALYGTTYLPQPGDLPEVLEYKRAARQRAVAAIEGGMSPAQLLAQEMALQKAGGDATAPAARVADGWAEIAPGVRIREKQ